jgi:hypothetical protein
VIEDWTSQNTERLSKAYVSKPFVVNYLNDSSPYRMAGLKRTLGRKKHLLARFLLLQREAGTAGAPVLRHARSNRVSTVTADEPPVPVGDHRSELDTYHAVWAADGQGRVGRSWHLRSSTGASKHSHSGFHHVQSRSLLENNESRASLPKGGTRSLPKFRRAAD